ncbi:hypothetical protein LguiB_006638 [Lonicera macranthoides]
MTPNPKIQQDSLSKHFSTIFLSLNTKYPIVSSPPTNPKNIYKKIKASINGVHTRRHLWSLHLPWPEKKIRRIKAFYVYIYANFISHSIYIYTVIHILRERK